MEEDNHIIGHVMFSKAEIILDDGSHFHHEIQLWNEVGIVSVLVEHIMLCASWAVNVPERLARQVFHLTPVLWLL